MPAQSLDKPNDGIELPWETGRFFQVWRYGAGHSQLLLHSRGDAGTRTINILFEAVEFMRLRRTCPDAVLRLATDDEHDLFGDLPSTRLLRLVISGATEPGLVACSRVTARETPSLDDDTGQRGPVLVHMTA